MIDNYLPTRLKTFQSLAERTCDATADGGTAVNKGPHRLAYNVLYLTRAAVNIEQI